jgi:hypothetical protein
MLTLTLMPMLAAAQMQQDTKLQARVPFDFMIGSRTVPAGQLIVQSATPGAGTLALRNWAAKVNMLSTVTRTEMKTPAANNVLVFHKYGHRYFLTEVKVEGSRTTYRLPESKVEAELQAQNVSATEEILLALK